MIDPDTLSKQRLAVVRPGETSCERCGKRTRDATGVCRPCRDGGVPDLRRLSVAQIAGIIEAAKGELKRRSDEITAAIEATR